MRKTSDDDDKRFETAKLYYQYIRSKQKRADELAIAQERKRRGRANTSGDERDV